MTVLQSPKAEPTAASSPERTGPKPRQRRRGRFLEAVARHSILIALLLIFLGPLVFVVLTALMTDQQALTQNLWPHPFHWSNFADVFDTVPLVRYFLNTLLVAGGFTVCAIVSSVPVAYALARFRFRGRTSLFVAFVAAMMLPPQVTVIPLYVLYAHLHWTGTPLPLIVPALFGDAFSIFLLRQFFVTVPQDYLDAARVDGAGELRVLWTAFLPMVRPAIAACGLFSFFYCWNDFFNPMLYVGNRPDWWTLSIALSQFRTVHQVQWNLAMAATLLFVLPVVAVFFFAQRAFVRGIALTGVKG